MGATKKSGLAEEDCYLGILDRVMSACPGMARLPTDIYPFLLYFLRGSCDYFVFRCCQVRTTEKLKSAVRLMEIDALGA